MFTGNLFKANNIKINLVRIKNVPTDIAEKLNANQEK